MEAALAELLAGPPVAPARWWQAGVLEATGDDEPDGV